MHTSVDPDTIVQRQLDDLEKSFFLSLQSDFSSLSEFEEGWSSFHHSVNGFMLDLQPDTLDRVHAFADTAATVSTSLIELHEVSQALQSRLMNDIASILEEHMADLSLGTKSTRIVPNPLEPTVTTPPLFTQHTSQWLLQNVNNPYPSFKTREGIAQLVGTKRRNIDHWFMETRKRIGWNSLRREAFSNRRSDIVRAATQICAGEKVDPPISHETESRLFDVVVQAKAYCATFLHSSVDLITSSDSTSQSHPPFEKTSRTSSSPLSYDSRTAAHSYPSPPPDSPANINSPISTPSPCQTELLLPGDPSRLSLKRRITIETEDNYRNANQKRCRRSMSPVDLDESSLLNLPSTDDQARPSQTNRKRRLSDSHCQHRPKRLCPDGWQARAQTVSNPLPSTPPLDMWFETLLEYGTGEPSFDTPIDVQLFNYPVYTADQVYPPTPESIADSPSPSPHGLGTIPLLDDLDWSLFQNTSDFASSAESIPPIQLSHHLGNQLQDTSHNTSIDPLYQPETTQSPLSAWLDLPIPPISQLNAIIIPTEGAHTLSSVDPTRAAKEQLLLEMKEATRKLEAELATS